MASHRAGSGRLLSSRWTSGMRIGAGTGPGWATRAGSGANSCGQSAGIAGKRIVGGSGTSWVTTPVGGMGSTENCLIRQFVHRGVAGVAGLIRHSWPVARFAPAILTGGTVWLSSLIRNLYRAQDPGPLGVVLPARVTSATSARRKLQASPH